ncbi:hypothetical protein RB595_003619 [Gaeumannomyces hyphopodioides]
MISTPPPRPPVQLTVIGCGTLGSAIVDGLVAQGPDALAKSYRVCLTARREAHVAELRARYPHGGIHVTSNNLSAKIWGDGGGGATATHIVVVATQPQYTRQVCLEIREAVESQQQHDQDEGRAAAAAAAARVPVVVTVCPGITVAQLEGWLPRGAPVVRSMPNTPVAVRQGSTAVFANGLVGDVDMAAVMGVLSTCSPCIELLRDESHLDVAAAISGSAPAYVFYLMRALVRAGVDKGLPEQQARALVAQSMLGGGLLAQTAGGSTLSTLLADVCVPGGSTIRAMDHLERSRVDEAVVAAADESWKANIAMGR